MSIDITNLTPMVSEILSAYQSYLKVKHGDRKLKKFNHLLNSNSEAAISEALVFNWLIESNQKPELYEDDSTGGADFICTPSKNYKYLVEVTCLGTQALTKGTGCHMIPGTPMSIGSATKILRDRVTGKAGQLAGATLPTVVVIASLHDGAYLLLRPDEAVNFLISDCAFTIPAASNGNDTYLSTDLSNSLFFKPDSQSPTKVVPCRQSISAVLLMPISGDRLNVVGILHPEPIYPFSINFLKKIPFVRLQKWPIENGEIFTEWVISDPYAAAFLHYNHIKRNIAELDNDKSADKKTLADWLA